MYLTSFNIFWRLQYVRSQLFFVIWESVGTRILAWQATACQLAELSLAIKPAQASMLTVIGFIMLLAPTHHMENYAKQQSSNLKTQEDTAFNINMRYMIMRVNLLYFRNCNWNPNELKPA